MTHILIAAGGTGGHVFPGLAVAQACQQQGARISWVGTADKLEARVVPEAGIAFHAIAVSGLRGKGWMSLLAAPWRLLRACCQAWWLLRQLNPDVVLGMGGFVSGPVGLMAWVQRRRLVIHEQNAIAGTTNRILARLANTVCAAFPAAFPPSARLHIVGNPVRDAIVAVGENPRADLHKPLRLFVLGGSLGARAFNQTMQGLVETLPTDKLPAIWHQTGQVDFDQIQAVYANAGVEARVDPFIDDMAAAYAWADIVLCRAGALTVSELASVGLPSILVPLPHAIDDHQTHNARYLSHANAAILCPQSQLTPAWLAQQLAHWSTSAGKKELIIIRKKAIDLAQAGAVEKIKMLLCE